MITFFRRWLRGVFGKTVDQPAAVVVQRRAPRAPEEDTAQAVAELAAISARRPLISAAGSVAGFEFRMGDDVARKLKRHTDAHMRVARVAALLASAHVMGQSGRIGLVRLPAEWLALACDAPLGPGVLIALESTPTVVPLPQDTAGLEAAVLALRAKGVQVGWEPQLDARLLPDFVLLRQGANAMSTVLDSMAAWPAEWQGLPVLATDIGNVEELEMALYNGVTYACGALDREGVAAAAQAPAGKRPLPPEVRRVGALLNQLSAAADTVTIVDHIKGDVGLSYRLLRLINNASYAQLSGYASVEQAVLLMGRYELYRWLSLLLMQFSGSRKAASALQEMTLWRSRLLELVAIERHEDAPDQFFTLGLASMLGQMLKISQAEVVSMLNLPAPASQALLEQSGPWHVYLQMAKRLESHTLDQSLELAALFGGTARLMELSDQAWRWAAQQTAQSDAPDAAKAV